MAKRSEKYKRVMVEILGYEVNVRKSKVEYLKNQKEARKNKIMIGGPGSRKIRRNLIKALPGYKNKYMQSSWRDHQIKTYGSEKYEYLKEMGKKRKDRNSFSIIKYLKFLALKKKYKRVV